MMTTSSEAARISCSSMISSFVLPARTVITLLPAALSAFTMGYMGATPTPPPAHTTVPNFSICVACPSGPTTSVISSPSFRLQSLVEDSPTSCTTSIIVPLSGSESAIVRGIRSPFSPTRTMTKCPAFLERAIRGASISNLNTFSERRSFFKILFITVTFLCFSCLY